MPEQNETPKALSPRALNGAIVGVERKLAELEHVTDRESAELWDKLSRLEARVKDLEAKMPARDEFLRRPA